MLARVVHTLHFANSRVHNKNFFLGHLLSNTIFLVFFHVKRSTFTICKLSCIVYLVYLTNIQTCSATVPRHALMSCQQRIIKRYVPLHMHKLKQLYIFHLNKFTQLYSFHKILSLEIFFGVKFGNLDGKSMIILSFHSVWDRCWKDVRAWRGTVAENDWNGYIKAWFCLSYDAFELLGAMGYKFNHFWLSVFIIIKRG